MNKVNWLNDCNAFNQFNLLQNLSKLFIYLHPANQSLYFNLPNGFLVLCLTPMSSITTATCPTNSFAPTLMMSSSSATTSMFNHFQSFELTKWAQLIQLAQQVILIHVVQSTQLVQWNELSQLTQLLQCLQPLQFTSNFSKLFIYLHSANQSLYFNFSKGFLVLLPNPNEFNYCNLPNKFNCSN